MFGDLSIGSSYLPHVCVCIFLNGILTFSLYISHIFLKQFLGYFFPVVVIVAVIIFLLYNLIDSVKTFGSYFHGHIFKGILFKPDSYQQTELV